MDTNKCILCGEDAEYVLVTTKLVGMIPVVYGGSYCAEHYVVFKEKQKESLENFVKWWKTILEKKKVKNK